MVGAQGLNVEFDGLADVLDGFFQRCSLTDATRQTGDFRHPKSAIALVNERLSHLANCSAVAANRSQTLLLLIIHRFPDPPR